jgi:sterol desaturase/sphingolipid hydroxylase (fatty acid hydroxylase superfamily)
MNSDDHLIAVLLGFIILIGLVFFQALIFWWLWNSIVIVALDNANQITYWQAFGLVFFITEFLKISKGGKKNE